MNGEKANRLTSERMQGSDPGYSLGFKRPIPDYSLRIMAAET